MLDIVDRSTLPTYLPVSNAKATSGFSDNFKASFDQTFRTRSVYGLEYELQNAYTENIRKARSLSGEDLEESFLLPMYYNAAAEKAGQQRKQIDDAFLPIEETFKAQNLKLEELKKQYPEIKSFDDIYTETVKNLKDIDDYASEKWDSAGFNGVVGGLLGGMAGSFSHRDPLNVLTLGAGGFGKSLGARLVTEFGLNAAVEGVNQFTGVQDNLDVLGIPRSVNEALAETLLVGAGAAGIRGVAEGAGPAVSAIERRINPEKAKAREIKKAIEDELKISPEALNNRMEMLEYYKGRRSQEARAAAMAIQDDIAKTPSGYVSTSKAEQTALVRSYLEAEGASEADIASILPYVREREPVQPAIYKFDEENIAREAREAEPELFGRIDGAKEELNRLSDQVNKLEQLVEDVRVPQALEKIDEPTGVRLQEIEEELNTTISPQRRAKLEKEKETLLSNFDAREVEGLVSGLKKGPRVKLRETRKKLKKARQNYRRLEREGAAVEARAANRLLEKRQNNLNLARTKVDELDQVENSLEMPQPKATEIVQKATADENINLGNKQIPEDFSFDLADGVTISARDMFEEFKEEDKMLQAMQECAI